MHDVRHQDSVVGSPEVAAHEVPFNVLLGGAVTILGGPDTDRKVEQRHLRPAMLPECLSVATVPAAQVKQLVSGREQRAKLLGGFDHALFTAAGV